MFENLDDPFAPDPGPVDGVVVRGRQLQFRRRAIITGAVAVVLVGGVATAAALHTTPARHVVIAAEPTTTTASTDTTTPDTATTTVPDSTTVDTTPTTDTSVAPIIVPATGTTTTQPPHDPHDYSMLKVTYGDALGILAGATRTVTYSVTNTGSWDVEWGGNPCPTTLWGSPPQDPVWSPYPAIWPQPYPTRGGQVCTAMAALHQLPAGATQSYSDQVIAGYSDGANGSGNVMPAPPGYTSYQPPFIAQCAQPCDYSQADSLPVTIYPPVYPPPASLYTVSVKDTSLTAASGAGTQVEITYTNGLAFTVRMPLWGPCWTVKSGTGTVNCSGNIPTVVVGPHATVDLIGTVWARAGFVKTGAPLAASATPYPMFIGDVPGDKSVDGKTTLKVT